MKVTVSTTLGEDRTYDDISAFSDFQNALQSDYGVPPEYQHLTTIEGKRIAEDEFSQLSGEVTLSLVADLAGGGGASTSIGAQTGKFEIKARICCAYAGLDEHWDKGQCLCIYCHCSVM